MLEDTEYIDTYITGKNVLRRVAEWLKEKLIF